MAVDALDPGPDGTFPYFPRLPDGSPAWSDRCPPGWTGSRMPRGLSTVRRGGQVFTVDLTPRMPDGTPVNPPTIQPV